MAKDLQNTTLEPFVLTALFSNNLVLADQDQVITTANGSESTVEARVVAPIAPTIDNTLTNNPNAPTIANTSATTAAPKQAWFLGDNKKKITIALKDSQAVYVQENHLSFLTSILNACKLNLGDVAIYNQLHTPHKFVDLQQTLQTQYLIVFDINTEELSLPFHMPHYQLQNFSNCSILLAPALDSFLQNTDIAKLEKSKLWVSLKKMFHL